MAQVTLEGVWKRFGKVEAVKNISLEVKDKEFMVFVGPSGCGKTTTLRMVAGLEEITEGKIYIGDRVVNDVAPKDRDIAMVFQNYALYPHMNVYQNMSFGLRLRRTPRPEIDKRVREAAEMLQIQNLLDRKPKQLSGGQRQRVALGRAIVRHPKVFLMDEPLSNLDAKLRVETRSQIAKLHQRLETTVIYVTHDQVEAMTMGHRITVMKDGVVQQVDTPLNLYNYPANRFVAGFIGSPAMNFLDVAMVNTPNGPQLKDETFEILVPDHLKAVVGPYIGQRVTMGVRPENIGLKNYTTIKESGNVVRATVEVVEPMGNEIQILVSAGTQTMIARIDPMAQLHPGNKVDLLLELSKLHLFDPKTELVLRAQ